MRIRHPESSRRPSGRLFGSLLPRIVPSAGLLAAAAIGAAPLPAAIGAAPLPSADGYYSYTAARGRWPANAGADGDRRYVTAALTPEDTPTMASMKASGRDIAVLYTGWDWCEAGSMMLPAWRRGLGPEFVTTVFDWPETPYVATIDGKETDLSARSRDSRYAGGVTIMPMRASDRSHAWPAIGFADSNGCGYALFPAVNGLDNEAMRTLAQTARARYLRFCEKRLRALRLTDTAFREAVQAGVRGLKLSGGTVTDAGGRPVTCDIYRAALMADALLELEPNVRRLGFLDRPGMQKPAFDALRTWDPDDVSGARRRLLGDDLYREAQRFVVTPPKGRTNEFPDGITPEQSAAWCAQRRSELAPELADAVDDTRLVPMSDNERQQTLLFGHNLYNRSDALSAEAYARAAVRVNPSSFWGESARGRLLMKGLGPVTLNAGWAPRHLSAPARQDLVSADGCIRLTAAELRAQDRFDADPKTGRFTWVLRWGNDMHFTQSGWYTLRMEMAPEAAKREPSQALTVDSFRIYSGARGRADAALAGAARLRFDGSPAVAADNAPTDGDCAGIFVPVKFPFTLNGGEGKAMTFYFAGGADYRRPAWEKNTAAQPQYNDVAIVITGSFKGPSAGTFSVTPLQTAPAGDAPKATEIVMDGKTLSLADAFGTLDARLAEAEPGKNCDGEKTADRIERLIDADGAYLKALTRAELFYEYELPEGYRGRLTETLADDACGRDLLSALLADTDWLTALLASGPEGFYRSPAKLPGPRRHRRGRAQVPAGMSKDAEARLPDDVGHDVPHRLAMLWEADALYRRQHAESRRGPLAAAPGSTDYDAFLRRLTAAYALNITGVGTDRLRTHYLMLRRFIDEGRMHGDFYTQRTPQLRFSAVSRGGHPADMAFAVRSGNTRCDQVNGTAWQMAYRLHNFFGDSVHSRDYRKPFYLTALPDGTALARAVGAVCGGISNYGAACGAASGRRALTGGQPGHCAGAHRSFDGRIWNIDSNVSAPTGNHLPLWSQNCYQALEFYDDLFDDPSTLTGYRLLWAARLRARRYGETDPGVEALLRRALRRAPLNYQAVLDLRDWLERRAGEDWERWQGWRNSVVRGFWRYPQIAWSLLNAHWLPRVARIRGDAALSEEIRRLYAEMQPSDRITREHFNAVRLTLAAHVPMVRGPEAKAGVVRAALETHYGRPGFVRMLRWGMTEFRKDGERARFFRLLDGLYRRHDAPLGTRAICLEELFYTSRKYQLNEFRAIAELQRDLWPDAFPVSETAADSGKRLLSSEGVLALSSYPRLNKKKGTEQALRHSAADAFYLTRILGAGASPEAVVRTSHRRGAWMVLQLKGDAEIRRVELSPGPAPQTVRVEISTDRKNWMTVADGVGLVPGETAVVRPGEVGVVRYIRIQPLGDGKAVRSLALSRFHVYGRGRY